MISRASSTDTNILDALRTAESTYAQASAFASKAASRLKRARAAVEKTGKPAAQVNALLEDLGKLQEPPPLPRVSEVIENLEQRLQDGREAGNRDFRNRLKQACEAAGLAFRPLPDGAAVGPFSLTVDANAEAASLHYANVEYLRKLPLDPARIAEQALAAASQLLQPPPEVEDPAALADRIEECVRVAVARAGGSVGRGELRADLPKVYEEMRLIGGGRKAGKQPYSLPQFVVDLKRLVQSEQNLRSQRRIRLETAVLENAKNRRRSLFIPADLNAGFGEGTYYQAIIVQNALPHAKS